MRCAIYTRVSTEDQSQDNQLAVLREFAMQQGWTVTQEFSDALSGKNGDRPGLKEAFSSASKRQYDVLLFWSLDRLTREGVLPTLQYLQRLTSYNVGWRSYQEQYVDSLGPFGDAVIGILAAVARQERLRISERTKAGLARVKSRGIKLGRPSANLDMNDVRRRMESGHSIRSIAKALDISPALIHKRLALTA